MTRSKMSTIKVRPMDEPPDELMERPDSVASLHYAEVAEVAEDVGSAVPQDDISPEARWIKSNMKMRNCRCFVKKDPESTLPPVKPQGRQIDGRTLTNDCLCECGYKKVDHMLPLKFSHDNEWSVDKNTTTSPTNTFGEIEFIGHGDNERKFVRVDVNTSMEKMEQLMMNVWGLQKPNLLISVTGGANFFNMKTKLKQAFRFGLMKAARSTGAWIVTGGTNTGVMKHVGEAVRDYGLTSTTGAPVVAIGVATWGCIHKKKDLISRDGNGLYPAQYRIGTEKIKVRKEAYLDPNHTHFILVDNGTEHSFAVEIPFRAKLENAVANMTTDTGKDAVKVPVCCLVAEGGPGTLETVHQSILNNIPIIIVQGSGRAADILAAAYEFSKESEKEYVDKYGKKTWRSETEFDSTQEAKIIDMIKDVFGDKNLVKNWQMVKESLVNRDLVTVFNLSPSSTNQASKDIDYAILKALLKANKDQVYDQLKLALAWNRIDIAKSEIFVDDRTWEPGSLDDILQSAIMLNRKDFIELFLDHSVSLKDFLSVTRLRQLYNQIPPKCQLSLLLRRTKQYNSDVTMSDVGYLIQELIGDFYASHHLHDTDVSMGVEMFTNANASSNQKGPGSFNAVQELFFWSVLMNRQELAKIFWKQGKDAIAGALVAYGLLKKLAKRTEDTELKKSLDRNAIDFSDLAIKVLNECHETDERKAQNLLIRQLDNWGGATCVLIAVETQNKHFISQTACQSLLNRVWMGRLSPENGALKLLICALLPPLMFTLIKYQAEDIDAGQIDNVSDDKPRVGKTLPRQEDGNKPGMIRQQTQLSIQTNYQQDEKEQPTSLSMLQKLYHFYTAPVIIFCHNVLSYLIFLALFSIMLLIDLSTNVSVIEIILMIWVFSIFAEEVRQLVTGSSATINAKLKSYLSDSWNLVDVLTIILFICALVLRFIPDDDTFEAARVVYAINFIVFFFRILHIFSVHRELGPKLVMIGNMVKDLSYFMVILMVFVTSYAVASYSILYPNISWSWDIVLKVLRMSYWNLYGELFIEDIELEEPDCSFDPASYNNGMPRCPTEVGRYATPVLMGIYVLFVNILLLNLLIAMFSYTIQRIQDSTDQHWNFQRYILIYEYYSKPPLPSPLILISHMFLFIRWCARKCCKRCLSTNQSDLIKRFPNERQLIQWENVIADAYLHKLEMMDLERLEIKMQLTHERLDQLLVRMDEVHETSQPSHVPVARNYDIQPIVKMPEQLDKRLRSLEEQVQTTTESLQWIVNAMKKSKLSLDDPAPEAYDPVKKEKEKLKMEKLQKEQDSMYVQSMISQQTETQTKSRIVNYGGTSIKKFPVPEDMASWEITWSEYKPVYYEAPEVKANPSWADHVNLLELSPKKRLKKIKFNEYDESCKYNRTSYLGEYQIIDGVPRNPMGRTGMIGRGLLGRWGPNHAGDPIVTRWKRNANGEKIQENGKYVFEFIAIIRSDNKLCSLPGGMVDPGQNVYECLKAEFKEEALGSLMDNEEHKKEIKDKLKIMFEEGELMYKGYADDPRNTDNAWLETLVYNYHDDTGTVLHPFQIQNQGLRAGESVDAVTWLTARANMTLHAAHAYYVKLVADKLNAAF
ncbi:transient receptor potential cation channel subfamily M member-like 2 isoform X5 [Mytilus californianus]|uniref:transient receptor potential cation channel subfamily M member-like 2 isoform X5 n=1 Tax=Mytilus californianus TaxID=6549 RepID=UPI002246A8AA|nr:transient receptor potential cation channel subfamily M member-like 2 isoform X5 [Mytilus californianus]